MKYHQELYIATRSLGLSGSRLLSPALRRFADKIQNNSGKPKVVRKYLCQVVRNTVRSLGGIQLTMLIYVSILRGEVLWIFVTHWHGELKELQILIVGCYSIQWTRLDIIQFVNTKSTSKPVCHSHHILHVSFKIWKGKPQTCWQIFQIMYWHIFTQH